MKRSTALLASLTVLCAALLAASGQTQKPLQIWVIDVEGGKAALFVSPAGESVLVDSGWPGFEDRDADRIMAAVADAGVKQIDYMVTTHYHVDHIGGLQALARRIPIVHYVDHGPTVEGPLASLREQVPGFWEAYQTLHGKARRIVVRPGDRLPMAGLDWLIVASAGDVLKTPHPAGGKPNPACTTFEAPTDTSNLRDPEDEQSVGSVISLGEFRAVDLGDLWWTKELELMCPNNPIGTVDLFFATSHGADASNALPLVHGLRPRVALLQNGPRKGGGVAALRTLRSSPGLEDVWQMHWSHHAGIELNSAGVYIANVDDMSTIATVLTAPGRGAGSGRGTPAAGGTAAAPPVATANPAPAGSAASRETSAVAGSQSPKPATAHGKAFWLEISAQSDGSFSITNSRNGFSKTYARRSDGQ